MLENTAAQVRVTNRNNAWNVRDKYGGQMYTFPPGQTVTVAQEVAEHVFGYGLDPRERWKKFLRMGIANHPKGKEMWDRIDIKPVGKIMPTGVERVVEGAKEMFGKAA